MTRKNQRKPANEPGVEQHYSPDDAAKILGIGRTKLYELMKVGVQTAGADGIFPFRKFGESTRIPASALQRYADRSTVQPLSGGRT